VSEPTVDVAARLEELAEAIRRVERRVAALERSGTAAPAAARRPGPAAAAGGGTLAEATADAAVGRVVPLVGRTLLVLAGAFVLRALTDAGKLPAAPGVALGFLYAGTWIAMADRAGRGGHALAAGFHGLAAVLIGFPLLFEAASRFQLISPAAALAALTLLTAVALGVAARRALQGLAWVTALGGVATAVALGVVSRGRIAPATLYLVLLGVATLWLGYVRDWVQLRWPVALVADLMAAVLAFQAGAPGSADGPGAGLAVLAALIGLYLGSIATRTLVLGRRVVPFEIVQSAAVIAVGLGGAVWVATRSGMGRAGFGLAATAFGAAAYAVAFAFVQRRQAGRANFYFYTSVAIVLVLAGTGLLLPLGAVGPAWGVLAVLACAAAQRERSRTLAAHGAAYGVGAAAASGLLAGGFSNAFLGLGPAWTPGVASLLALAALAASAWLGSRAVARATMSERLPQLALVVALAASVAAVAIAWLVPAVAGSDPTASPGATAAVRTGVLVVGAVALAWLGRREAWTEAGWLAWPLLGAAGLKILLEDMPRSRPATLFVSFALYGAALILVPRLRARRGGGEGKGAAPGPPATGGKPVAGSDAGDRPTGT
jgi:hypothetical protein